MRDYGKIFCAFWSAGDIQSLSDQGKILAAYLLTSQHTTLIGCFRAPFGYIQEDLKWSRETVSSAFSELSRNGFATVDEPTGWVLIHKYLHWNPIENPNQGKQAVRIYEQMPESMPLLSALERAFVEYGRFLPDEFLKGLGTVNEPSRNQEQEQEKEQEVPPTPSPAAPGGRRSRRRGNALEAFSPEASRIVGELRPIWRKEDPDGRPIRVDLSLWGQRLDEILKAHPEVTPDMLIEAGRNYTEGERFRYQAPQFFFGVGREGAEAAWVGYVRLLITKRQPAEVPLAS